MIVPLVDWKQAPSDEELGFAYWQAAELLERDGVDAALAFSSATGFADDDGQTLHASLGLFKEGLCQIKDCAVDRAGWRRRAERLASVADRASNPYYAILVSGSYLAGGDEGMARRWLWLACPESSVDCVLGLVDRLQQELVKNFSYDAIDVAHYFDTASTAYSLLGDQRFLEHRITAGAAYRVELGERLMAVAESRGLSRQAAQSAFCSGLLLGRYPDRHDGPVDYPGC